MTCVPPTTTATPWRRSATAPTRFSPAAGPGPWTTCWPRSASCATWPRSPCAKETTMNPDLEALLRQPWTARRLPAGDRVQILVEAASGAPVCTAGVLAGDTRTDALTLALGRALAALPPLVG